jgi:F0F1-type ATP synthase membrane subunit b/b'
MILIGCLYDFIKKKLENKVNQGIEDKFTKSANDVDKLKKDLKSGLADVEQAIEMLQKVIEGKIKISEDRLEKEIDKIKKMVVLM